METEFFDFILIEYHDILFFVWWAVWVYGGAKKIPVEFARLRLGFNALLGFGFMIVLHVLQPVHLLLRMSLLVLMAVIVYRGWRNIEAD